MAIEETKEVVKAAASNMSVFGHLIDWIVGGIASGGAWVWGHLIGRIKALEDAAQTKLVTKSDLEGHMEEEEKTLRDLNSNFDHRLAAIDEKFDVLFKYHDKSNDKISRISEAVARIEGKLGNPSYISADLRTK